MIERVSYHQLVILHRWLPQAITVSWKLNYADEG